MTCLLCVALGCIGTIAVSFLIAVVVGKAISHGADYANERSDAAWAELNEQDDQP